MPVERTSSTIPPDLINTVMRRPYRERFRLILNELGTGLAGRPEELNEVIRRAHPALRELSQTLSILRGQNRVIRDFIRDADTVSAAVEPNKEDLAKWANEAADTAGIQASRSEELGRYWNRLPDFLAELEPTLAELERTADQQIPTLRSLGRAAPELERFLRGRPAVRARDAAARSRPWARPPTWATRRSTESRQEVAELRRLAALRAAPGQAAAPVPPDDRRPPPLDRERPAGRGPGAARPRQDRLQGGPGLHRHGGALELRLLPDARHQRVRRGRPPAADRRCSTRGPCPPYVAKPTEAEIKECNSWLGPNQPGVTTARAQAGLDARGRAAPRAARPSRAPATSAADRGPGDPEAPQVRQGRATQIELPPQVKELLDQLGKTLPKDTPPLPLDGDAARQRQQLGETDQLLDYLLAP